MMKVANPPKVSPPANEALTKDARQYGVVIGALAGFCENGSPLVSLGDRPALTAMTLVDVGEQHIGMRVAVQFEGGDLGLPLVIGVVRDNSGVGSSAGASAARVTSECGLSATIDDDEIVLIARRRITLRCGAASVTLDSDGNVEIRGKHLLSRAAGQNRIKGSSVSLN
ncbi:DUF6484 domain-containing protein [Massilia scottii]|uniref:DUF6484 domain-containing protein n=1 Tax=Massilia scottii TaxID=3057166 RepID=UPI002796C08C|nr:DUF6484 domain-containing protein [Massilia sp. CCM 9029]MDQ1829719.1 DUF6484 domain-containing protein [Massilia sp. CCM 9029]